ncbi:DUF4286 family protein [Mesorhizobium sp. DCY119]|uniref:DUF4286 family protein n=1 Tax=Mesorhizobium sp. DCY119 TaxID=2108445 RepID=UPI000E73C33B|nr:DUF4286 family protein [Mesorhizobium sp. DCY119]RJG41458.1 hypothetical protein D3Y55_30370 [Mesorhizobium sp. DCY119]
MEKKAYKFVVLTNAVEGRDGEFNDWYSGTHVPDVLAVPGIVKAERFELANVQRSTLPLPYRYLAIYEIETDDLKSVSDEIGKRAGTDAMVLSSAMAQEKLAAIFKPL